MVYVSPKRNAAAKAATPSWHTWVADLVFMFILARRCCVGGYYEGQRSVLGHATRLGGARLESAGQTGAVIFHVHMHSRQCSAAGYIARFEATKDKKCRLSMSRRGTFCRLQNRGRVDDLSPVKAAAKTKPDREAFRSGEVAMRDNKRKLHWKLPAATSERPPRKRL